MGGVNGVWCILVKARPDTVRILARSYGRKGFLCSSSGWANGNCGRYAPGGGIRLPLIVVGGGICGWVPAAVVSGLKSATGVGGKVVGMGDPETTIKENLDYYAATLKV